MNRWLIAGLIGLGASVSCATGIDPPALSEMVRIEGGAFFMGSEPAQVLNPQGALVTDGPGRCRQSSDSEPSCYDRRQVRRCVVVSSYVLDRHEVTNDQFRHCVERGGCSKQEFSNAGAHKDYRDEGQFDIHPAAGVTWFQAREYCEWAGKRLPSEAEWEFAAEGSEGRRFPWGDDAPDSCEVNNNSCSITTHGDTAGSPVEVMSREYDRDSTPDLVRDLGGNVQEWVADIYEDTAYCDSTDTSMFSCGNGDATCLRAECNALPNCVTSCEAGHAMGFYCHAPPINAVFANPKGPVGNVSPSTEMVIRGSWFDASTICAVEGSHRTSFRADATNQNVGFRCARDLRSGGQSCGSDADCGSGDCDGGTCTGEQLPTSCAAL